MKYIELTAILALVLILSSCYHTKIITDAEPSGEVIDKPWASSFIFGLVPPKEVRTASECGNGVAQVDTQISFLNGLVSAITFNIYTPMHITVTCAAGSGMSILELNPVNETTVLKSNNSGDKEIEDTIPGSNL